MSRPILSRPRTRVYGCNYDKGESYYKPMVDHLDRKYSARPLFSEPRTSLADEIAARRGDIGMRPRNSSFGRDLDLESDPSSIRAPKLPTLSPLAADGNLFPDDDDIVYDSRGQRSRRGRARFAVENIGNDLPRHIKSQLAGIGLEEDADTLLGLSRRVRKEHDQQLERNTLNVRRNVQELRSSSGVDTAAIFNATSKAARNGLEILEDTKPTFTKWTKMIDEVEGGENLLPASSAALRARQTKARLNDLKSEMEELAEKQAKREKRTAALRALISETVTEAENV